MDEDEDADFAENSYMDHLRPSDARAQNCLAAQHKVQFAAHHVALREKCTRCPCCAKLRRAI